MKNTFSPICQQAKIVDLENNAVVSYAQTYDPDVYKPVSRTAPAQEFSAAMRKRRPEHSEAHPYLICWEHGRTASFWSNKAPHQFTPDEVERLYYKASPLKPINLGGAG